jgi:hypothetical protein
MAGADHVSARVPRSRETGSGARGGRAFARSRPGFHVARTHRALISSSQPPHRPPVHLSPCPHVEVQIHLSELLVERALALVEGLATDGAYMADLDDEIAATRHAYIAAAITEIATLRVELSGSQVG